MPLDIATIIAKNYLAQARTLAHSFRKYHPGDRVFVLLVDRVESLFDPEREPFALIEVEQLSDEIPNLPQFIFQYPLLELATAVKPFFLDYLFRKHHCEKLAYLDPDILVTWKLEPLADLLDHHSVVLTPHLTAPLDDSGRPSEVDILLAGTYNLGFIALHSDARSQRLLTWWKTRLEKGCIVDPHRGYHVDQRWIDLAPGLFEGVRVLREPGYNVAYWNLHERRITSTGDTLRCNGEPLYFFHFSGFNPDRPEEVSRFQDRHRMSTIGLAREMFRRYARALVENGYHEDKGWPYAFGTFDNGVRIPDVARRILHALDEKKAAAFPNPFMTASPRSFFRWLTASNGRALPPLLLEMYRSHSGLDQAFPDITGRDRIPFMTWVVSEGRVHFNLDGALLTAVQAAAGPPKRAAVSRAVTAAWIWGRLRLAYHRLRQYPALRPVLEKVRPAVTARVKRMYLPAARRARAATSAPSASGHIDRREFGVNVAGYIHSETGVGAAVRSDIDCLESAGIPYVLNNVDDPGSLNTEVRFTAFSRENPYLMNLIHVNADQVPAFVGDKGKSYLTGHYNIGCWTWELSTFPPAWLPSFAPLDEIWVPSTFVLDAVSRVSPLPVLRIPYCIPCAGRGLTPKRSRKDFGLPAEAFIFLFIFDFHSYMARKNPEGVLRAFQKAFSPGDGALLVLKYSHSDSHLAERAHLARLVEGHSGIGVIDAVMAGEEVLSLLAAADCYVSLHRSEGFGLTMAEAMAVGKPVIATGYSGNMDFMTSFNSYPIRYGLTEIDRDYGPYRRGSVWADPDVDDAARAMRHVYEHRDEAARIGRAAAADMQRSFSSSAVGRLYEARLRCIRERWEPEFLPGTRLGAGRLAG